MVDQLYSLWRRIDGATAVEMALVLLTVILFMVGIVEFARAYWNWNSLQLAAQQGARYAMAHAASQSLTACGTPSPAPTITGCSGVTPSTLPNCAAYQTVQSLIGITPSSVTVTCSGGSPTTISISATYNFDFVASGLFPYGPIALTGTATAPLM